ncbi:prepilin peptidase [Lacrimispora aerotolerans]|uniref:prepilin peptidase n=1 Tax=Lacrimispora aerotolerans TaxID=36832 RepID=UPI000479DBB2|nr:prepilin peptidase [Lacrimispora aerotolerans]
MPEGISKIVFTIFLVYSAFQDGRSKTISVWLLFAAGTAGILFIIISGQGIGDRPLSCLIGLLMVGISRLSDGAIGEGDGWFFTVSGLFLNLLINLKLLVYGVFLSGFVCMGIYIFFRLKGNDVKKVTIPFLPFLLPAWIGLVML